MSDELCQRIVRLLELIETVETAALGDDQCPFCGPPGGGMHRESCELMLVLKELKK